MKYIKYYQTLAEYNADEKVRPNVSYIADIDELRYLGDWIIPIEDATLKAILVENFDTDGDGEISKEEALAVTEPFPSLINTAAAVDLTALKYFKNVEYKGDMKQLFYYWSGSNTWLTISFDGCNFGNCTSLRQFFGNRKLTYVSMKNCDFSKVTNWQGFCPIPGSQKDLVIDFSGSTFASFESITNYTQFLFSAKSYSFIMNGCDTTALNTIKGMTNGCYISSMSGKIKIDIDGTRWTLTGSTPNQTWVSSEI